MQQLVPGWCHVMQHIHRSKDTSPYTIHSSFVSDTVINIIVGLPAPSLRLLPNNTNSVETGLNRFVQLVMDQRIH